MNRRTFLEKSGLFMAGLGTTGVIHPAILKAITIEPIKNSTFYDAEHVVILMQENRSFDHTFGALKGVRGFLDKRAFKKQDGHSVFFQKNTEGKYAAPARLDIKNTKSTWMSSLPHSWTDQQNALNKGKYDQWITSKASGNKDYKSIPLTLGYHNRQDLPFYYQLADAFTVFDQYFCSSLTGTTPNRLYLWSGTIREQQNGSAKANVFNSDIDYDQKKQANWKSFPEILEEQNISWRIYQNEISLPKGMSPEEEGWLANFTDNPIEWFSNFKVKFSKGYHAYIPELIKKITAEIEKKPQQKERLEQIITELKEDLVNYHPSEFDKLTDFQKSIHQKAFTTNENAPDYWNLEIGTDEHGEKLVIPKGDVLYQFRKDVENKKLPLVSWLVAPEHFSDHPSSPWYGAWYISEVMNILTQDPEVWKKTIFIINYDENDGYFDHVIPFSPPQNPSQPVDWNGKDGTEYVNKAQDFLKDQKNNRIEGTIGLGYRVPMLIASPWTRGGFVNSEVTDHTSVLQFLENFIEKKYNKNVKVNNISNWRRAICGNLTSAFNQGEVQLPSLDYLDQKDFATQINSAKNKPIPQIKWFAEEELTEDLLNIQERGIKPANPLPYHFDVNLVNNEIKMQNFTTKGVPLQIYDRNAFNTENFFFSYALYTEQSLYHRLEKAPFEVEVLGPNGFYRKFLNKGNVNLQVAFSHQKNGEIKIIIENNSEEIGLLTLKNLYEKSLKNIKMKGMTEKELILDLSKRKGWYDFILESQHGDIWHFAGRIDSGKTTITDPHWL